MSNPNRSSEGDRLDLMRLQERVDELEARLAYVADAVEAWPDHPWIPGAAFIQDDELRGIITMHRSAT